MKAGKSEFKHPFVHDLGDLALVITSPSRLPCRVVIKRKVCECVLPKTGDHTFFRPNWLF